MVMMERAVVAGRCVDVLYGTLQMAIGHLGPPGRFLDVGGQVLRSRSPSFFGPGAKRPGVLRVVLDPMGEQDT